MKSTIQTFVSKSSHQVNLAIIKHCKNSLKTQSSLYINKQTDN